MGNTVINGELMHMGGVPVTPLLLGLTYGDKYFLDPVNGNDTNDGKSVDTAFKTMEVAEDALTNNNNDILFYIGGSSGLNLTQQLVWDKSYTHLVGISAPVGAGKRARIFMTSTVTSTPMIQITGSGCVFSNLYIFHGIANAAALVCVEVTGGRNYFDNVHFAGIGNATQDAAGACSLKLNGAEENKFNNCQIGLDTQGTRGANSSEILCDGSAVRNEFVDCLIYAYISAAGHPLVKIADNAGLDRYLRFRNCTFLSESLNNGTAMTSAFSIPASMVTSYIILDQCRAIGITAWDSNSRGKLYADMVAPAASAGGGLSTNL